MGKERAWEGHWKGLWLEMNPRRKKACRLASLFLGLLGQISQAGKALQELLPDTCMGSWRETSVMRQRGSQEPEELAVSI